MQKLSIAFGLLLSAISPSFAQSTFVTTTQNSSQNSIVISGTHTLVAFHVTGPFPSGAVVLVWDAASLPATGALSNIPKGCFAIQSPNAASLDTSLGMANTPAPVSATTGLVIALSAASGAVSDCYNYTPVNGYISVIYQ